MSSVDERLRSQIEEQQNCGPHVRPTVHITAQGWINDPCAPGYDPNTGLYHLFYQTNPHGCAWGNMSWGHLTSKDLLTWKRMPIQPALKPDQEYDRHGVFTGCFAPPTEPNTTQLTVFFSSICRLPFHWSTPPYPRNAAGLALATSPDGGMTWVKSRHNPILAGEPEGVAVTGFRDPYTGEWPALDQLRGNQARSLYGLVSGGIEGCGPTTFLYEIAPHDLTAWKYLGPLVDLPSTFQPSKKWSGNHGINWECTNFMTLHSNATARHFLLVGAEGDTERDHVKRHPRPPTLPPRTVRSQLWMCGDLVKRGDGVRFDRKYGGVLDHGCYYAANSFLDPPSGRRIVHGWIPEEDCPLERARQKGWNGSLAIPRESFLVCIPTVTRALHSLLSEISCVERETQSDGSTTLYTLGVRPVSEVDHLRGNCLQFHAIDQVSLPRPTSTQQQHLLSTACPTWELSATISCSASCETVGFHIRHSTDFSVRTTVAFSPRTETLTVHRDASTPFPDINTCPEQGPFTLFTSREPATGEERQEKLWLRIFSDGDVLEVFANDRFALATMIYSGAGVGNSGVTAFATGGEESALFEEIRLWDGLGGMKSLIVDELRN